MNEVIEDLNKNLNVQQEVIGTLAKQEQVNKITEKLEGCARSKDVEVLRSALDHTTSEIKSEISKQEESLKQEMKATSKDFGHDIKNIRDEVNLNLAKCAMKSDFDTQTDFLSQKLEDLNTIVSQSIEKNQTKFDSVDKLVLIKYIFRQINYLKH